MKQQKQAVKSIEVYERKCLKAKFTLINESGASRENTIKYYP